MRIGERQAPDRTLAPSRASAAPADFGAGVATALQTLGGTLQERGLSDAQLIAQQRDRQQRLERQNFEVDFRRRQGEWARELAQAQNEAPAGAPNFTNQIEERLRQRTSDFLGTISDPEVRRDFEARTEAFLQTATTSAFTFEFEESNRAFGSEVEGLVDEAQTRLREDPRGLDFELEQFTDLIAESALPEPQKEALLSQVATSLISTQYQREIELAQAELSPIAQPTGADVVAPGLPATVRGLLNTISGVEAPSYNTLVGGGNNTFRGFKDHPRIFVPEANSTAAGRYQFIASTWDFVVRNMRAEGYEFGPEEFSPVNQDRAAWWYARYRFNQAARTGNFPPEFRDFDAIMASGDREGLKVVRRALAGIGDNTAWKGLQNLSDDSFANQVLGVNGARRGPTGTSRTPDLWSDPRYAALSFEDRLALDQGGAEAMQKAREARAAAAREQVDQTYAQLLRQIGERQEGSLAAVEAALAADINFTPSQREKLRDDTAQFREDRDLRVETDRRIAAGETLTTADAPALDARYRSSGITAGIRSMDQEAAAVLLNDFSAHEVAAPEVVDLLLQQTRSSNPQAQLFGLQTLSALYDASPRAFMAGAPEEAVKEAAFFSTVSRYSASPNEVLDRFATARAPGGATVRAQLRAAATEALEDFSADDTFAKVTSVWQRNLPEFLTGRISPELPAQAADNILFQEDYRTLFTEAMVRFGGDESAAHEYAGQLMTYSWMVDPLGGNLMKFSPLAPGANVPAVGGSREWIDEVVREQLKLPADADINLISSPATERAFIAGEPPVYNVLVQEEIGDSGIFVPALARNDDGSLKEVRIEPTERVLARQEVLNQITRLEERVRRLDASLGLIKEPIVPEGQSLRSFVQTPEGEAAFAERAAEVQRLRGQIRTLRGELQTAELRDLREGPEGVGQDALEQSIQALEAEIAELQASPMITSDAPLRALQSELEALQQQRRNGVK